MTSSATTRPLPAIDVVVFDVVGTIVDEVGTVTRATCDVLGEAGVDSDRAAGVAEEWLNGVGAATGRVAAGEQEWASYDDLGRELLAQLLGRERVDLPDRAFDELATVGHRLTPWPDAPDQIAGLGETRLVAGLTNAATAQIAEISARGHLRWHAMLSTELARTYKPAPAAYRLAVDLLDLDPQRTLFVAAHPWDLRAAATHGFRTGYLPRPHADGPEPGDRFDVTLDSLDELIEPLRAVTAAPRRGSRAG